MAEATERVRAGYVPRVTRDLGLEPEVKQLLALAWNLELLSGCRPWALSLQDVRAFLGRGVSEKAWDYVGWLITRGAIREEQHMAIHLVIQPDGVSLVTIEPGSDSEELDDFLTWAIIRDHVRAMDKALVHELRDTLELHLAERRAKTARVNP